MTFIKNHLKTFIFAALSIAVMFACWAVAWSIEGNELVVTSPAKSLRSFFELFAEGEFWSALVFTLIRALAAVAISFALAAICAAVVIIYRPARAFFSPVIAVCRTLPTIAVTLILMLWLGAFTPIAVTVLIIFPMLYSQLLAAVDGVDSGLLDMAKAYGLGKKKTVFKIYLPQVAPAIISQLGGVVSFALKITVSSELLSYVYDGIGYLMKDANMWYRTARFAALTLACVAVGLAVEGAFALINKFTFRWRYAK